MFDIHLRLMNDDGTPGRILSTLQSDVTLTDSVSSQTRFTVSEHVAGRLDEPFLISAEYSTGGKFQGMRHGLMIATKASSDASDPAKSVAFSAVGFLPWLMARMYVQATSTSGMTRTWPNATPGTLAAAVVAEAKVWGWGPHVTVDFTATHDSNGVAWTTEDRSEIAWRVGTPMDQVLEQLSEQGKAEWWTEGTTLRLFRPGTGVDRTDSVVLGGGDSSPAQTSFDDVFSRLTVFYDNDRYVNLTNSGANTRFGALWSTMSQSGVKTASEATALAQPAMVLARGLSEELSYDWTPASSGPVPFKDFEIGDMVTARRRAGKAPQRVIGMVVSKQETVTVRVYVGTRILSVLGKVVKRTKSTSTGRHTGGSGNTAPVTNAPPAAPTGLIVTSEAYFDDYGTAYASVTGTCATVNTDVQGGTISVKWYELWGKKVAAGESWILLTRTEANPPTMMYSGLLAGETWGFKARVSTAGNQYSDFSTVWSMTLAKDLIPPPIPAPPVGTSRLGQVLLTHTGLDAGGQPQPVDFSHFNVWVATTATGAGSKVGEVRGAPDVFIGPQQPYNSARWYWVTAEDKSKNKSDPSTRIPVTTQPLVDTDVSDEIMDSITEIVNQEVISNIGGTATWSINAPVVGDGAGKPVGAIWYRRDGSNNIIGMWEWSGAAWQSRSIDAGAVAAGAITDAKIATGAVLEGKIADAAVATAKLKDSAITEVKIANLAVGTAKIADAAIVNAKIGNLAVSTAKIADAAIVTAKIGDAQITNAKIGDAQITNAKIVNLDAGKLNVGFIDAARIDARTITANKLAITDLTNYMENPTVDDGTLAGWYGQVGQWSVISSTREHINRLIYRNSGTTGTATILNNAVMPVRAGMRIRVSALTYCTDGGFQSLGVQWFDAAGAALSTSTSTITDSSNYVEKVNEWNVPDGAFGAQFRIGDNGVAGSISRVANPRLEIMGAGKLIVDGSITALQIAANTITANEIAANAITVDEIDAGAITTVKLAALAVTTAKLAVDAVDANKIVANAITSKHTITGAKFQTSATPHRGIEITSFGLSAYNSAGQSTVSISATTGDATFTGTVRNQRTGPRVQISSLDTQAVIWFYGASEGGSILPASIYSDPNGQSLFLAGGNPNTSTPIYSKLELNERTSSVSWFLGRSGFEGAAAYPRIRGDESTNTFWERSTGHRVTLATDGYTELVGNGLKIYGSLNTTGSKNFVMDHPTKPGVSLTHASTESPHNGVEYWSDGLVEIPAQGFKTVTLPPYFEALTAPDHRVAILTSGTPDAGLSYEAIVDGKMIVHGTPGALFSWVVKARRVKVVDGVDVLAFPIESATTYPTDPTEPTDLERQLQGVQP